jgi:tetratricopeptide (TPR) repeat protein
MATQKEAYQQALAFIQAGDLEKARELLARLIKADKGNVDYWLWMSAVVKTTKERVYCLREVLALDPKNEDAALGLRMLGEKAPEADPSQTIYIKKVPWKTRMEIADEHPTGTRFVKSRVLFLSLLIVGVVCLFGFGIYMATRPTVTQNMDTVKRWTITAPPTSTFTVTAGPTSEGYAALVIPADRTVTPTPLYVATPHSRMEAYGAAMRAYEKGNWDSAIEYLNQVLVDEPNSPDIYYHLGDIYRFQGKYKEALSAYQTGIQVDPNFAPSYLGKGRALLEQTSPAPADAIAALQIGVSKDPNMAEAYLELARANLMLNDPTTAIGWLEKYTQYGAENATSAMFKAETYLALGDSENALESVETAYEMDPTNVHVYTVWAKVLQSLGQYDESIPPLLTVLQVNPLDTDAQTLLALAYYKIGDQEKAFSTISMLIEQDPENISAYLLRADIYLDQGNPDEASKDYNMVLRYDFNNFDANLGLGRVFLANGLAGAAYNKFDYSERLAKTDTQKAVLIYWMAKAHQRLDQATAAIPDYQAALAYPGSVLPQELREDAEFQLSILYTPTPTAKPTLTPTVTKTSPATATPAATITVKAAPTQ